MAGKHKKTKKTRGAALIIITIIIVALAVLSFLYKDELFGAKEYSGDSSIGSSEPYTYENGSNQSFELMGKNLAVASSTGLQILDQNGYTISRSVFAMKNPAVSASEKHCVFYDIGGTELRLFTGGNIVQLNTDESIISVSMNRSGYFAVATQESGYKACVTVYNSAGEPVYKWYSGSGYVIDAAISPDSSKLSVLCLESSGSVVHLLELKSEEELSTVNLEGKIAFKLSYMDNGNFCLLTDSSIHFYKQGGGLLSEFDFGGRYLTDYHLTDELCVISLGKFVSGGEVTLIGFSTQGKQSGEVQLPYFPVALSVNKQKLLLVGSGIASVFSREMILLSETEVPAGYSMALYLPDGEALLLSSYHGEKISVK